MSVDCYLGEVRIFAGNFAPEGWRICDGSKLPISNYQALFALLGTQFGGDGVTNFAIPDLRGRLCVGQGQGDGLSKRVLGGTGGVDVVGLTEAQMPAHTHLVNATSGRAVVGTPDPNQTLAAVESNLAVYNNAANPTISTGNFSTNMIGSAGSSNSHDNCMPVTALNYIIAVDGGEYPPQS